MSKAKEEWAAYQREWRAKNPGKASAYVKKSRKKRPQSHRDANKRYAARKPDKVLDLDLKKRYGIGLHEYQLMFDAQKGLCAVCERPQADFKKRFAVDHCHTTGVVRGLLCSHCNLALGHLKDDLTALRRATAYLERYNNEPKPADCPIPRPHEQARPQCEPVASFHLLESRCDAGAA